MGEGVGPKSDKGGSVDLVLERTKILKILRTSFRNGPLLGVKLSLHERSRWKIQNKNNAKIAKNPGKDH